MKKIRLMFLPLLLALVTSCGEKKSSICMEKYIGSYPGVYDVDYPKDIRNYMDSLIASGDASVEVHNNDSINYGVVWNGVNALFNYAQGNRKYYPTEEIHKAIEQLVIEQGYRYSHGVENSDTQETLSKGEIFLFRFMEQAALHAPKIDFISQFHCDDSGAGILYYQEWGINPLYSILVYKAEKGYRIKMIGDKACVKIEKIFHLEDKQGREYYLCSDNSCLLYFNQFVYMKDGNDMKLVASTCSMGYGEDDPMYNDYHIIFNPGKLTWKCCSKEGDVFHRIDGTPILGLILDGDSTRFESTRN